MILRKLSEAIGVAGDEHGIRAVILEAIRPHIDDVRVDTLGNVLAVKEGTGESDLRVMVAAHMDEIGLMVVGHDGDGFLQVRAVGGIDPRLLPGTFVRVGEDQLPGVIGVKPIHIVKSAEGQKVTPIKDLVVDVGARGKEEAEKLAPLGTYVNFNTPFRALGPSVSGKAFDDRAGCAVLVELLRGERFPFDLHAAFTVQEEVGLRGAQVAAYAMEPDCAFALEGTIADDTPKDRDVSPTTELGKGPAITVMDRSFVADRRLLDLLTGTAEALNIPHQFKQPGIGGTDAGAIHTSRRGVPSATVAVPCRYIHSPVSLLRLEDFDATVRLMRESLSRLSRRTLRRN
jgi:endoglucanase